MWLGSPHVAPDWFPAARMKYEWHKYAKDLSHERRIERKKTVTSNPTKEKGYDRMNRTSIHPTAGVCWKLKKYTTIILVYKCQRALVGWDQRDSLAGCRSIPCWSHFTQSPHTLLPTAVKTNNSQMELCWVLLLQMLIMIVKVARHW